LKSCPALNIQRTNNGLTVQNMRRNARDALQKKIEIERIREFIEEEEEEEEEDDYNEGEEYGCDEEYYDPILNPNFKGDLGGRIDTRSFQRLATT